MTLCRFKIAKAPSDTGLPDVGDKVEYGVAAEGRRMCYGELQLSDAAKARLRELEAERRADEAEHA